MIASGHMVRGSQKFELNLDQEKKNLKLVKSNTASQHILLHVKA